MLQQDIARLWPDWEAVRIIGRGNFGAVYEIRRDTFGHTESAALKVITIPQNESDIDDLYSDGHTTESITMRFQSYLEDIVREYNLMVDMKGHPNVVYCDDLRFIQHEDGIGWNIYIKMELLTPLVKHFIAGAPEQEVIHLGRDICSALVLCRQMKIVHRDIKPQNIFVSRTGQYKLGDFGIAKTAERTTGGTKIGTYKYMAPEVYHNRPYGSGADIYSLGLVLYWLLNDRRTPFQPTDHIPTASEEETARHRRLAGEAIPAPVHGSPELKAIVLKACAYDPKERFASAEEMLVAFEALERGVPVLAPAPVAVVVEESKEAETVAEANAEPVDAPKVDAEPETVAECAAESALVDDEDTIFPERVDEEDTVCPTEDTVVPSAEDDTVRPADAVPYHAFDLDPEPEVQNEPVPVKTEEGAVGASAAVEENGAEGQSFERMSVKPEKRKKQKLMLFVLATIFALLIALPALSPRLAFELIAGDSERIPVSKSDFALMPNALVDLARGETYSIGLGEDGEIRVSGELSGWRKVLANCHAN